MKTRSFYAIIPAATVESLTDEQRAHLVTFKDRQTLISEFDQNCVPWSEDDVRPHAMLKVTLKVASVVQHNPNEGVWVEGVRAIDVSRLKRLGGKGHWFTARANRVEGWRWSTV